MAKRHERTFARKAALQVLYSAELNGCAPSEIIDADLIPPDVQKFSNYAQDLVAGIEAHAQEVDKYLHDASENWALDRMPVVDRCILRIAVYEMCYMDKVPTSVSINEAVDLAKDFGGEDESSRFVNGILGKIAKMIEAEGVGALEGSSDKSDESGGIGEASDDSQNSEDSASAVLSMPDTNATNDSSDSSISNSKDV